jgi:ABC-type transport system substrate-binding protein
MTSGSISSLIPGAFTNFKTGGSVNWGMWSNSKVDEALDTIQSSTDQDQQQEAWNTIQQEIIDQLPFVPSWRGNYGYAYDASKFGGVELTYYGQIAFYGPMYRKSN